MFPISVEGAIEIPTDGANAALDRLRVAIAAKGATSVQRQDDRLLFNGRIFFVFLVFVDYWNPLLLFDRCVVSIQPQNLEYSCSTKALLILTMVMSVLVWLAMLSSPQKISIAIMAIFPPLAWLVVFGINYLAGRARIRAFLTTAVKA
jgi:hypothetical protein